MFAESFLIQRCYQKSLNMSITIKALRKNTLAEREHVLASHAKKAGLIYVRQLNENDIKGIDGFGALGGFL